MVFLIFMFVKYSFFCEFINIKIFFRKKMQVESPK